MTVYVGVPHGEATLTPAERVGGTQDDRPETVVEGVEIGLFADPESHTIGVIRSGA